MPAMSRSHFSHTGPVGILTALGLLSGIVSAVWGQAFALEALRPLGTVFGLDPAVMPIGAFFGTAMGVAMAIEVRNVWALPVMLPATMYAWSAAIHTAIRLQRNAGDDTHLVAASLAAGAVGAGLTHIACSVFAPELRRPSRIATTCAVGAVAGMLFFMGERQIIDERLLYLIWQPLVALSIGFALSRGRSHA